MCGGSFGSETGKEAGMPVIYYCVSGKLTPISILLDVIFIVVPPAGSMMSYYWNFFIRDIPAMKYVRQHVRGFQLASDWLHSEV